MNDTRARNGASRFFLSLDEEDGATPIGASERPGAQAPSSRMAFATTYSRTGAGNSLRSEADDNDELDAPPIDFPLLQPDVPEKPPAPAPAVVPSGQSTLLGQVREQLRAGRTELLTKKPPAQPHSSRSTDAANTTRSVKPVQRTGRRARRLWFGPLMMAVGAVGAYVVSTTSLSLLAPTLSRSPRVPELGSLNPPAAQGQAAVAIAGPSPHRTGETREAPPPVEVVPMPEGLSYPGRGLLEVVTRERELVYVDSIFIGRGPLRRIPLVPGTHAIIIRSGGVDRTSPAQVQASMATRVHFETSELAPASTEAPEPE